MELLHHVGIRYTLHTESVAGKLRAFVLCTRQAPGETLFPRLGARYDIRDEFVTPIAAHASGVTTARMLAAGELSAGRSEMKKKIGEYQLIASAAYHIESHQWEPTLKIKSKRPENKGAVQDLLDEQTPLQRNLCATPERATDFALEHGERLVLKLIPGLKV